MVKIKKRKKRTRRHGRAKTQNPSSFDKTDIASADNIVFETSFGKITVPTGVYLPNQVEKTDARLLDLTSCDVDISYLSPGLVSLALTDAERFDPGLCGELGLPTLIPGIIIRGERGKMMQAAPILRRIRTIFVHPEDGHGVLIGDIYGMPRVALAKFAIGEECDSFVAELAQMKESWMGRYFIILASQKPGKTREQALECGEFIAAHEVILDPRIVADWEL